LIRALNAEIQWTKSFVAKKSVEKVWIKEKKSCHKLDLSRQPLERQSGAVPIELWFSEECSSHTRD